MIWVSWRQQRTETLIAAGILGLLLALLVPTGLQMASAYHHDGIAACLVPHAGTSCDDAVQSFVERFSRVSGLISWLTLVPGLLGVLLAAPFISQLEYGTYRLDWTQSVTRGRWIAGKLALAIGAALLASLVFTLLITWWQTPLVHVHGRMDNSVFDSEGTVVFGYTLFALGLALAAGVIWRRAVPAIVVSFAGYFAARLFVETWLRQHLLTPLTATWSRDTPGPDLAHAWVLTEYPSDKLGRHELLPRNCVRAIGSARGLVDPSCLANHKAGFMHAVYEPASRFWPLQGLETGIFAGAALLLIAFAAWWTNSRTA